MAKATLPGPVKARADRHPAKWSGELGGVLYDPRAYEILVSGDQSLCALKMTGDPRYPAPSITVPMTAEDALRIGALLIAHSDWLSGRPIRDWSELTAA